MVKHVKTIAEMDAELLAAADTKTVVVDFFAPWCGPCKKISPKLKKFQKLYPNVVTLKVNIEEAVDLADKYEISALPTLLAFQQGVIVDTVIGGDLNEVEELYKRYGLPVDETASTPISESQGSDKNIHLVEVMDTTDAVSVQASSAAGAIDSS